MNRNKFRIPYSVFRIPYSVLAILCILSLTTACAPEPDPDPAISEITIYNIPAQIPINGNSDVSNNTYKIYLNASNFQDDDRPPAAQGSAILTPDMLQEDGRYTVTIELRRPIINLRDRPDGTPNPYNPPGHIYDPNIKPNEDAGSWRGTANYFSLMISPATISEDVGEDAIWVIGSTSPLNKGSQITNWDSLIDFRFHMENPQTGLAKSLGLESKVRALYEDIVARDPHITIKQ